MSSGLKVRPRTMALMLSASAIALLAAMTSGMAQDALSVRPTQRSAPKFAIMAQNAVVPVSNLSPTSISLPPSGSSTGDGTVAAGAPANAGYGSALMPNVDVDESGLRFYAAQGQRERVEIETRRLHALYPMWKVPDDLYAPVADNNPDEQQLWDMFAADKLDELKTTIEARMAAEPGWKPSPDLSSKLKRKMARTQVISMANLRDWPKLADLYKRDPSVADSADVEVLWYLADAVALAKQSGDALAIYKNILSWNNNSAERLATVQRAMSVLRINDVEALIAQGRRTSNGRSEFDVILVDLTRARISSYLADERKEDIPASDLQAFAEYARSVSDANQAGLVSWYYYKHKDFQNALEWFKYALEKGGDAKIAHGLAHSLRELGMKREAEEVAYAWREYDNANMILYVDLLETELTKEIPVYVEPDRLARYGKVTMELASGEGAQALGWYALNTCQYQVALEWFQRAVAWFPKQGTVIGYAVSLKKLEKRREFVEVVNRYDGLFPKVVELIFPSISTKPPPACEAPPLQQMVSNAPVMPYAVANPYAQPAYLQQAVPPLAQMAAASPYERARQTNWASVPSPTGAPAPQNVNPAFAQQQANAGNLQLPPAKPLVSPAEFPIPVFAENPLRFVATAQLAPGTAVPAQAFPAAVASAHAREPFQGPWQLRARKVFGVEPMPYDRADFIAAATLAYQQQNPVEPVQPAGKRSRGAPQQLITNSIAAPEQRFQVAAAQGLGGQFVYPSSPYAPTQVTYPPQSAPVQIAPVQVAPVAPRRAAPVLVAPATPAPRLRPGAAKSVPAAGRANCSVTSGTLGGSAALNNGWCLMNADRPGEAIIAFDQAINSGDASVRDQAAYGKSLALLRGNLTGQASQAASSSPMTAEKRQSLGIDLLTQRAIGLYNSGNYNEALVALDQRLQYAQETRGLTMIRGWIFYHLGNLAAASRIFHTLDQQLSTKESRDGLAGIEVKTIGKRE